MCDKMGTDNQGCFLSARSISSNDPPAVKASCPSSSDCVFDTSNSDGLSVCELDSSCNDVLHSASLLDDDLICSDLVRNQVSLGVNRIVLKPSCSYLNTSGCFTASETVCNSPSAVVCNPVGFGCRFVYNSSACQVVTTYHGPSCVIDSGCAQVEGVFDWNVSLPLNISGSPNISSCKSVADYKALNSSFNHSLEDGSFGFKSVSCAEHSYCSDSGVSGVLCLGVNNSLGQSLRLVDSSSNPRELFCDDQTDQFHWCSGTIGL